MTPTARRPIARIALTLALVLLAVLAPSTDASSLSSGYERRLMTMVNRERAARGLAPLRYDSRLWDLAGDRAARMSATNVLSHSIAGSLGSQLRARRIQWYAYGEVIAYSTDTSASRVTSHLFRLWKSSPSHWRLLMSDRLNYLGVGMDRRPGKTFGAIVLTESRDRTGAIAEMSGVSRSGNDLRFAWTGWDPRLQTHTAGLHSFAIQIRADSGPWRQIVTTTTATAKTLEDLAGGHVYRMRVRARDRRGNLGAWSSEVRAWVP